MENVIIIAVVAVVVILGLSSTVKHMKGQGGCCGGGSTVREHKKLAHAAGRKIVTIEGMMCENCEARVERFINNIDGAACRASHKKKQAIVSYEKDVTDEQIRAAVEQAGYKVLEIQGE